MTYQNNKKKRVAFPIILLVIAILYLGVMSAISLNKIRDGHPGFLTNLWVSEPKYLDDPILAANAQALAVPNNVKTVMLLGSDFRPELGYRTDVILLAAFNLDTSEIHLVSFPRDLWVDIPGVGPQRINVAYPSGGFPTMGDTLAINFGFRPDHYAMVDFEGFKHIIDVLDGIDVEVTQHMEDECFLNDQGWCVVEPGTHYMRAAEALWYVRARLNSSDFDRTRRAQEVVQAMVKKALRPTEIANLDNLYRAVSATTETDLTIGNAWPYVLPLSRYFKDEIFTTYQITPNEAVPGMTEGGASVLYPDYGAIRDILKQVLWVEE